MLVENLKKVHNTTNEKVTALNDFSYKFEKGKLYVVTGHSGSGKSTLVKLLGLIDNISDGKYYLNNKDVTLLNDAELSKVRMKNIGFVFQEYYLDHNLKAYENVMLPMLINKAFFRKDRKKRADDLLKVFGLNDRLNHYPKELSGGEQQRVAIARALANNPDYILADEPTGNLDSENEKKILDILKGLSKQGKCVIVISHSKKILKYADEVIVLKNGKMVSGNEDN